MAIKTAQLGVFYYSDVVALEALFLESGHIEPAVFVSGWKSIPDANEATKQLPLGIASVEELQVNFLVAVPQYVIESRGSSKTLSVPNS